MKQRAYTIIAPRPMQPFAKVVSRIFTRNSTCGARRSRSSVTRKMLHYNFVFFFFFVFLLLFSRLCRRSGAVLFPETKEKNKYNRNNCLMWPTSTTNPESRTRLVVYFRTVGLKDLSFGQIWQHFGVMKMLFFSKILIFKSNKCVTFERLSYC